MLMFSNYTPQGGFDEYFAAPNQPRSCFEPLISSLGHLGLEEISRSHRAAETLLQQVGATFQLYSGDTDSGERILPFDPLPRLITARDWAWMEAGLIQRLQAIDLFLGDIYGDQHIINDGVIPRDHIETSQGWRPAMVGITPPLERWCHVAGLDLIRDEEGAWKVLEDNLRCPSGVAYYLENRRVMKRMFPSLFHSRTVQAIDDYPSYLLQTLQDLAPWTETPKVVVLTPGSFNSAYFEHSYLAQQMGVELVEGRDLFCEDGRVWLNSTNGSQIVDVIYRRIDDEFLDPACFRPDSLLGVRGLMDVYRQGHVSIANAPGTGVADDKLIYTYIPEIIDFYLKEKPKLKNVTTYRCSRAEDLDYVLANLDKLVIKSVSEAGGYGMLIGPHATTKEQEEFSHRIRTNPRNFIAQPTLYLSTVPSISHGEIYPCHVDLRPYCLRGRQQWISPGGLTRVALRRNSLVVNSSQGGGCKDTWVIQDDVSSVAVPC